MKLSKIWLLAAVAAASLAGPASAATITQWNFNTLAPLTLVTNPVPEIGAGTAIPLGMNNGYTFTNGPPVVAPFPITGSVDHEDVIATPGSSTNSATDQAWRVRGPATNSGPNTGNGWALQAPQFTQGAQFNVNTTGFSNVVFKYDWFTTNQGIADQQAQYTTNGITWTSVGALQVATPNAFNNGITIDFTALGITSVNNDPLFGVRLVSVYDPTYNGPGAPAYTGASGGLYNNNSGNWRFDNVTVSGVAVPEPSSIVLAGLGLIGLYFCGKRRRRAA